MSGIKGNKNQSHRNFCLRVSLLCVIEYVSMKKTCGTQSNFVPISRAANKLQQSAEQASLLHYESCERKACRMHDAKTSNVPNALTSRRLQN